MFKHIILSLLTWPYYGFNWVGDKYYTQLGHKIEPKHFEKGFIDSAPERKLWKGMTFRPIQKRRDNSVYEVNGAQNDKG